VRPPCHRPAVRPPCHRPAFRPPCHRPAVRLPCLPPAHPFHFWVWWYRSAVFTSVVRRNTPGWWQALCCRCQNPPRPRGQFKA
jgi:hypothetical protein